MHLQNRHRSSNPTTPPPKKSIPKTISTKRKAIIRIGNYFSKSPKLTTNRLESPPSNPHKQQNKHALHAFTDDYISSSTKRQLSPDSNSSSRDKRLSNSTEDSNSNPNSMEDNASINGVFCAENSNIPRLKSANTRYRELMKEYVDTESTLSSSDIQDDISSVASDEIPTNSYKPPPRNAPPPPPSFPQRKNSKHIKSKSMNSTPITQKTHLSKNASKDNIPSPIDTIQKPKYSRSAVSTPTELCKAQYTGRKRSQIRLSPTELFNNPYIHTVDFPSIKEPKIQKKPIGLPPPKSPIIAAISMTNHSNNTYHDTLKRPKSATIKSYRSRPRNNLPFYEIPKQIRNLTLTKSRSMNISKKKKRTKRHVSEDITHVQKSQNLNTNTRDRLHYRAQSARMVDDLSLSEKIYQNRRTVLHRLRGKNKKDVMSKLDISIGKVEEKLKVYVRNLVGLQDELQKLNKKMNKELSEWESINNFSLTNLCRSYYSNFGLLIQIRIEIATKYCECFRDKYRQLKKTRDRIKKDAKRYSLDDLVLTVEAAMMSASNIRLPPDINAKRENEAALKSVISELKSKYAEKKYEDVVSPMSAHDRTKHILTMLVQIIDTSNKTTMTRNVSNGLPYFHPTDNGYQVPFEQLLYDPRFEQKKTIDEFIAKYISNRDEMNHKVIDRENLSLTKISTFIYKLTNSFLDSCELNRDSPFFQKLFWDCTNLMIGRSIFPKFDCVIQYVINKDKDSVDCDEKYEKQLIWMKTLDQKQIGIETQFTYYYRNMKTSKNLLKTARQSQSNIFFDENTKNESKIAYYRPIHSFKNIENISIPQDSIVLVIDTVHEIQKCAIKYGKMNQLKSNDVHSSVIISGDSLFPIIVYCLVQCNVHYWNRWLFMMRKFYTPKILSFGQTGFCFSLINAAVQYISDQKPSNFGLNDD